MTTLHLVIGKIASGKSTLVSRLSQQEKTVAIGEDSWLSKLHGEEIESIADYVRLSTNLRTVLSPHIVSLLENGVSVVLDFQANTYEARAWMKELALQAGFESQFHFLDVPDKVCKERLKLRNEQGEHAFSASEEVYDRITSYFQTPDEKENLNIIHYPWPDEQDR